MATSPEEYARARVCVCETEETAEHKIFKMAVVSEIFR